jgi:hypothetical protein
MHIRLCKPTGRPNGPPDDGLGEAIRHLGPQQLDSSQMLPCADASRLSQAMTTDGELRDEPKESA